MRIDNPWVIVFKNDDGEMQTQLYPEAKTYQQYGILVADIVRHIAKAFDVTEDDVWEWVETERYHQSSPEAEIRPN